MTRPPKLALRLMAGLFAATLLVAACNNKKDEKKDAPPMDTASVKPAPPVPMKDTTGGDTTKQRPVSPGD